MLGLQILRSEGGNTLPVKVHSEAMLPATAREYRDESVAAGATYNYTVVAKTETGVDYLSPTVTVDIPMRDMAMFPNYPNPFNPVTTISFDLPQAGHARLSIYDAKGRLITTLVDNFLQAGVASYEWNGTDARGRRVSSGVYLAKLDAGGKVQTQKLTLLE